MCSLIENALFNLLNVPFNYLSKHSLPNCLYVYSDLGGVISSSYTFNALCGMWLSQVCGNWRVKMCSLKKSWGEPCDSNKNFNT